MNNEYKDVLGSFTLIVLLVLGMKSKLLFF
jgi:hypothetical protein